jgi:tetratricopeptide (TPR) repeat protein
MALFGFALYANTLGHLYALDDNLVIYGHKYVEQGIHGIKGIFSTPFTYGTSEINDRGYRPIVLLTFALEIQLFGKNAFFPQHLTQVLLYSFLALFLFLLLRRLFIGWSMLFPVVVSLLYIAHPIHTEVVANLKSRDELMGFLFGFVLTLYALCLAIDSNKRKYLWFGFVFFLIGIFSKENVITYLVIIPLTLFMFTKLSLRQILALCWPLVLIVGFYLGVREYVLSQYPTPPYDMMQNILMGASSQIERYSTAMLVMLKYLGLLLVPHPLAWDYSYNQIPLTALHDWRVWLSVLLHTAMLGFALWKIWYRDIYAYAILFYLTTMSINSNLFVMTNCTLGERFLFAPSLGFCIALSAGFFAIYRRAKPAIQHQRGLQLATLISIVLILYSIKTIDRNQAWKDTLSLSLADIKTNPKSIRVLSTLGAVYLTLAKRETDPVTRKKLYSQILPLAHKILELDPNHKEASYNIGISHYFLGDLQRAEEAFYAHLKRHPGDVKTYNNIGGLYYFRKDYSTALGYFKKFVTANPRDEKAIHNLGIIYLNNLNQPDNAITYFQRAIDLSPRYAEAYKSLGDAWLRKRQILKTIEYYRKAAELDPARMGHLTRNMGQILKRGLPASPQPKLR